MKLKSYFEHFFACPATFSPPPWEGVGGWVTAFLRHSERSEESRGASKRNVRGVNVVHSIVLSPHEPLYLERHCGSRRVPNGVAHGGSEFRLRQVFLECFEHFFTRPPLAHPLRGGWLAALRRDGRGVLRKEMFERKCYRHQSIWSRKRYMQGHCGSRRVPNGVAHGGSEFRLRQVFLECFEHFFARAAIFSPPPWGAAAQFCSTALWAVSCAAAGGVASPTGVTAVLAAVTGRGVGHRISASFRA